MQSGSSLNLWRCDAFLDGRHPDRRSQSHDQHEHNQGNQHGQFAEVQIGGGLHGCQLTIGPVEQPLHQPQHVRGAKDNTESGGEGPTAAHTGKGAGENQELADETVQHRQADHGESRDDKERRSARQLARNSRHRQRFG